ncbi:MAG TPA: hypothetical protein VK358_17990 [Longimicrobium sp.]|nr:hypothetical protein [Longimicrobium sp.]
MKKQGIDPILEEVDEMRRRIMAKHGNDWRKVLDHYVEVGKQQQNPEAKSESAERGQSVA